MTVSLPVLSSSFQPLGGFEPLNLLQSGAALKGQYDDSALLTGRGGLFGGSLPLELPSLRAFDLLGLGKLSADALSWLDRHDVDKYVGFAVGSAVGMYFGGKLGQTVGGNLGAIAGDQAGTDLARIAQRLWA